MNNNLKRMKRNEKKGFTLVEIIVVLVILAIMAAIAVPAVMGYIQDAKDSKYVSEARSIYLVVQTESAKAAATDDSAMTFDNVKDTATDKTGLTVDSIVQTTPTGGTPKTNNGTVYTIKFTSEDGTAVTATVNKNKEVKISHS